MRLNHPVLQKPLGLVGSLIGRLLRRTIDGAIYFDPTVDPVHPQFKGRYLYVGWHEYQLMPIVLRGHCNILALAGHHADAELLCQAMRHLGWEITRGSTTRGGTVALMRLLLDDSRHVIITPDGPRGPRRQMALGPIFLASKLGLPLVCMGCGFQRPWRARSWDRFAVPRPFTRARAVVGPPVRLPANLSRPGMEAYRRWTEKLMNRLTDDAEAWAASGLARAGELPLLPSKPSLAMCRAPLTPCVRLPGDVIQEWHDLQHRFAPLEPWDTAVRASWESTNFLQDAMD